VKAKIREPIRVVQPERDRNGDTRDPLELIERQQGSICGIYLSSNLGRRDSDHPPRPGSTQRKEGGETVVAEEEIQRIGSDRSVNFDITKHEGLWVRVTLERNAGRLSDVAVGAVAAGNVSRAQLLLAAIEAPERAGNTVRVRCQRGGFDASLDALSYRNQVVIEDRFRFCLRDEEDEREFRVDRANIVEGNHELFLRAQMDRDARGRISALAKSVPNAQILQNLEAPRMDDECPGLVRPIDETIDQPRPHSECLERRGEHEAGGSRTHH